MTVKLNRPWPFALALLGSLKPFDVCPPDGELNDCQVLPVAESITNT